MSGSNVNLQESFLNHVRKEGVQVEVMLANGAAFQGQVRGFDNFTVIMHVDGKQHLIYKHAIAQIVAPKFVAKPRPATDETHAEQPESAERPPARRRKETVRARERKPENAPAEKFNSIDFSAVKIDLTRTEAKPTQ